MSIHTILALVWFKTKFAYVRLFTIAVFVLNMSLDVIVVLYNFATFFTFKSILHTLHLYKTTRLVKIYISNFNSYFLKEIPCSSLIWLCLLCLVLKATPQISQGKYKFKCLCSICFFRSVLWDDCLPHSTHSQHEEVNIRVSSAHCSSISTSKAMHY